LVPGNKEHVSVVLDKYANTIAKLIYLSPTSYATTLYPHNRGLSIRLHTALLSRVSTYALEIVLSNSHDRIMIG